MSEKIKRATTKAGDMLSDSRLHEAARSIGTSAVEGTGVVKMGKDGRPKIKKLGVAKAVVLPHMTMKKAVVGAARGALKGARKEASSQARSAATDYAKGRLTKSRSDDGGTPLEIYAAPTRRKRRQMEKAANQEQRSSTGTETGPAVDFPSQTAEIVPARGGLRGVLERRRAQNASAEHHQIPIAKTSTPDLPDPRSIHEQFYGDYGQPSHTPPGDPSKP